MKSKRQTILFYWTIFPRFVFSLIKKFQHLICIYNFTFNHIFRFIPTFRMEKVTEEKVANAAIERWWTRLVANFLLFFCCCRFWVHTQAIVCRMQTRRNNLIGLFYQYYRWINTKDSSSSLPLPLSVLHAISMRRDVTTCTKNNNNNMYQFYRSGARAGGNI